LQQPALDPAGLRSAVARNRERETQAARFPDLRMAHPASTATAAIIMSPSTLAGGPIGQDRARKPVLLAPRASNGD
jgi:hypothetical protein